jgi:hypothetical protein
LHISNSRAALHGFVLAVARQNLPPGFVCDTVQPLRWQGAMNFSVGLIDPKTSEERTVFVSASAEQVAAAMASGHPIRAIQELSETDWPAGFFPIGNHVFPRV